MAILPVTSGLVAHFEVKFGVLDSGGAPASPDEDVETWEDQSVNGNDVDASSASERPVFRASGYGGHGFLEFAGRPANSDGLTITPAFVGAWNHTPTTAFWVYRQTVVSPELNRTITQSPGGTQHQLAQSLALSQVVFGGSIFLNLGAPDTVLHLDVAFHRGDATSSIRRDGADVATGNVGTGGTITNILMNRSPSNANNGDLELVAYVVYDRILTTTEVDDVEAYFDAEYALDLGLATAAAGGVGMGVGLGILGEG